MLIGSKNEHTDYQYNSNGQLTKTTEKITDATTNNQTSQITVTFTYDNNGNMLSKAKSGSETGTTSYSYNTMNQMIQHTNPKGVKTYYTYNGNGQRETKKIGTKTTKYYYDGGKVVNETENGSIIATNIRGINLIARQDNKGAIAYYIYNGHGDTVNLILSNGSITSTYDYDIYGKETKATEGSIKNPYRYAGEYYDEESELYYLRARYYDPSIGRFISEDTYKGDIKDPLSLNLYTYCMNNPIRYIDPSGHITQEEIDLYNNGQMSPGAYSYLMDLTYRWYLADSQTFRENLHAEAERFRANNYMYGDSEKYNKLIKSMPNIPNKGNISRDEHYFRNQLNLEFPYSVLQKLNKRLPENLKWEKLPISKSLFHMFNGELSNEKYVSGYGHFEAVYDKDSNLLNQYNNPVNMGTYNYYTPHNAKFHAKYDVKPYFLYGNVPLTKEIILRYRYLF